MLDNLNLAIRIPLEQKKYHLQRQIIEALRANDNDLYSLLKSQWAHRFGVESLEELENIDLSELNQNTNNLDNTKTNESQENSLEVGKDIYMKDDTQENDIKNKQFDSIKDENNESFKTKSYKISEGKNDKNEALKQLKNHKKLDDIKVLIPLPPKPKYGFLGKWLLRK